MSQDQAIDLTLELSDDDDNAFPIYLSSSQSTPHRVSSPEPDEIQVIESPVRTLDRSPVARRGALLSGLKPSEESSSGSTASIGTTASSSQASTSRSHRPKPRSRNRNGDEDVSAVSTPGTGSSQTEPQPCANGETSTSSSGKNRTQRGKARDVTAEDLLFALGIGATSTPSSTKVVASRAAETSTLSSTAKGNRRRTDEHNGRTAVPQAVGNSPRTSFVLPSSPENPLGSWTLKSTSKPTEFEKDGSRWTVGDDSMEGLAPDIPSVYQPSISGSPLASSSGNPDSQRSSTKPISESIPQPGPSRVSTRTRKKSQRAVESEETAHLLGINVRRSPLRSSSRTLAAPRASSTVSTSSRISALHRYSLARSEPFTESGEADGTVNHIQGRRAPKPTPSVVEMDPGSDDVGSMDIDWTILPANESSEASKRNRRRSSPEPESHNSANSTPQRSHTSGENDGASSTPRRGTRPRKASEAMKEYVAQVGPRFSKRLSGKPMPVSSGIRLPPPPPLESFNDDTEESVQAPMSPNQHADDSSFNTRSGFSLPSVPSNSPLPAASRTSVTATGVSVGTFAAATPSTARKALPRRAKGRVNVHELPIATSTPSHPPRAAMSQTVPPFVLPPDPLPSPATALRLSQAQHVKDIPFPPCSTEDGENEYLTAVDFADAKLLAAFAALDASGNKAMSAEQIAAVCLERGWLSKDLGASAPACISNALRSYYRRCQSATGPRKPILSKRILFGGFPEASLFQGLHQGMLKKMLDAGKGRPRGSFFYLEGWVGSARWRSPFAGLDTADTPAEPPIEPPAEPPMEPPMRPMEPPMEPMPSSSKPVSQVPKPPIQSTKRDTASRSTGKKSVVLPRKAPAGRRRNTERASVSTAIATTSVQPLLSPKLRFKIPPRASIPQQSDLPARSLPAHRIPPLVEIAARGASSEESDGESEQSRYSSGTDEDSSISRRYDLYTELRFDSDADSDSDSDSDIDSSGDSTADESSSEASPEAANRIAAERKANANPTIYLSLSGDTKGAVFPDNPLGPLVWDRCLGAHLATYTFDEVTFVDLPSRDFVDDAATQDVSEEGSGVYQSARASSTTRSTTPGIPWAEDFAAFREPPDLYHEDVDTPPTSPESCSDTAEDDFRMIDANDVVWVEHSDIADEMPDDSLIVDAVRTLRGLLSEYPISSTSSTTDFSCQDLQGPTKETVRRLRFRSEDSAKISLALPPCVPSPSSSPPITSIFATHGTNHMTEMPSSPSPSKDDARDRFASSFDLVPGLLEQRSQIDIECQEICEFDAKAIEGGILDEVKYVHRQLFEAVNNLAETSAAMLGPESVTANELDDAWGSASAIALNPTASRSTHQADSSTTVGKETFFNHESDMLKDFLMESIDLKRKEHSEEPDVPRVMTCTSDPDSGLRMDIDEDDQIGIKEVDDAMLCSWLEEDAFVEKADGSSASLEDRPHDVPESDDLHGSEGGLPSKMECDSHATPIAVNPNLLGISKPAALQVPRTLPTVPALARSSTSNMSASWMNAKHLPQGSKAIPPLALRPRAMVQCAVASQSKLDGPASNPPTVSVLPQPDATPSATNRRRDRANVPIDEKLVIIIADGIPAFTLPWNSVFLLRRIDSDYINISTLCRSLRRTDLEAQLQSLPGAVEVSGNKQSNINGFWVHLSLVTERAQVLGIPEDLRRVWLDPNLIRRFPALLGTLQNLRVTVRGLPKFGAPFGYCHDSAAAGQNTPTSSNAGAGTSQRPVSAPSGSETRQASSVAQTSLATSSSDAATQPRNTAIKRPSSSARLGSPHPAEPPSKRQRSTESPAPTSTASVSRNVRPIIPVGVVTTTCGASVVKSRSTLTAELSGR